MFGGASEKGAGVTVRAVHHRRHGQIVQGSCLVSVSAGMQHNQLWLRRFSMPSP